MTTSPNKSSRLVPDFRRLKVGPHKIDPRAATSVVIAGMTLGLALMLVWSLSAPVRPAAPSKMEEVQVAAPPAAEKVTIVAPPSTDAPKLDVPCADQTWPYIDRRCLTETTRRPQPQAKPAEAAETPALDARNATSPVIPVVNPATVATSEPQPPATPAARAQDTKPETVGAVSREASILDGEATQPQAQNRTNGEAAPLVVPRSREQARRGERRRVADPGQRIVRRWKEIVQVLPGGGTRKVTIFPRGMF